MHGYAFELTGIDYHTVLTISSLAFQNARKRGVLDGVCRMSGRTGLFWEECVVGG